MSEPFADLHKEQSGMYDCIVVGGGALGLGSAYQMAKQGYNTLLLEQFSLPHSRGSSSGMSRMYRNAYQEEHHSQMVGEIKQMWEELERETKTTLHRKSGLLIFNKMEMNPISFQTVRQNMIERKLPFQDLSMEDLKNQFPLMSYQDDYRILLDTEAGFLIANKCMLMLQNMFLKNGGTLHDGEKVLKIEPGRIVTVHTNKGRQYKAGSLVLTTGPWASQLLKPLGLNLPLKVWRVNVCYFKEKLPGSYMHYPMMFDEADSGFMYCFPSQDYPGYMKFGFHLLWNEVNPDERDKKDMVQVDIEKIKLYVQKHFPGLEATPAIIETCMYTSTPEEDIIVDTHPVYHNIAIGCGFSGKGFKMAPLMGKILGDLSMGKPPKYDIRPISMKRFLNQTSKL